MNDTPKTKLTIDDLVEAQRETANSLKAIESLLELLAKKENLRTDNEWPITLYVVGCLGVLALTGWLNSLEKQTQGKENVVYVGSTLIELFIFAFVGFYAVRYFAAASAANQRHSQELDSQQAEIDAEVDKSMIGLFRRKAK